MVEYLFGSYWFLGACVLSAIAAGYTYVRAAKGRKEHGNGVT